SRMMKMKQFLAGLLLGAALIHPACAAEAAPAPSTLPELLTAIEKLMTATRTPGVALALVDREGLIYAGALGLADVADDTPATADTLFRIGSISKGFVALAALQLQAEGRLDLNATLASVAPEIEFTNAWEASAPVRLVHLLEHTAG